MGSFIEKIREGRIHGKYSLVRKIGQGGHAAVYLGRDYDTGEEVALKMEHRDLESLLQEEVRVYETVVGLLGFPKIYSYDWQDGYKVLAFELLGPSLEDVFAFCGGQLSLKTTLLIVDQLLSRIEALHSLGFVHRDIKPGNCLLGTGTDGNVIFLTDFGIAEQFNLAEAEVENPDRRTSQLIGTTRFASVQAHSAQRPKDDLESLLYTIIYLMKGCLPWQGKKANSGESLDNLIFEMKKDRSVIRKLFAGLPAEFEAYLKYLNSIPPNHPPDYVRLRNSFRGLARRNGIEYDDVYDWTEMMYLLEQ